MWIEGNYRRNLMDMHIDDWNEEFLSKIDVDEYVEALKDAGLWEKIQKLPQKEKTFIVQIKDTESGTWQGTVQWVEKEKKPEPKDSAANGK